jgi:hypothetical protein
MLLPRERNGGLTLDLRAAAASVGIMPLNNDSRAEGSERARPRIAPRLRQR